MDAPLCRWKTNVAKTGEVRFYYNKLKNSGNCYDMRILCQRSKSSNVWVNLSGSYSEFLGFQGMRSAVCTFVLILDVTQICLSSAGLKKQKKNMVHWNYMPLMHIGQMYQEQTSQQTVRNQITFGSFAQGPCTAASVRLFHEVLFIFFRSSSRNFLLAWLHSSCSTAHLPVELSRKHFTKPWK